MALHIQNKFTGIALDWRGRWNLEGITEVNFDEFYDFPIIFQIFIIKERLIKIYNFYDNFDFFDNFQHF